MKLEFYKQAIEKSPSIVVITNINGEFVYVNPKFTQVTGYTLEEILGKKTSILKSGELSKEYYEKMQQALQELNKEGSFQAKSLQELALKVFDITRDFPKEEKYSLI